MKDTNITSFDNPQPVDQESEKSSLDLPLHPNGTVVREKQEWTENRISPTQQSDNQYSAESMTRDNEEMEAPSLLPPVAVNSISGMEEDSQMSEPTEGASGGFSESTMVPVKWPKV